MAFALWQAHQRNSPRFVNLARLLPSWPNDMRDARELSAQTGDAMRWFAYSFALVLPWISLGILGPWPGILTACAGVGFWL